MLKIRLLTSIIQENLPNFRDVSWLFRGEMRVISWILDISNGIGNGICEEKPSLLLSKCHKRSF